MGNRGRFGKYGEIKRLDRLKRARKGPPFSREADFKSPGRASHHRKSVGESTPVRIRPAKPSDSRFILLLSENVFRIYGPYEKIIGGWLESGMTVTLIALMNRKPAGFAMISHFPQEANLQQISEILAIAVTPEKQRTGSGEMLLKALERKAAGINIRELFLHTAEENLAAQNLFIKNKYVSRGIIESFYPAGQNALVMSKKIGKIPSP